jgi:hypothetical protein
MALAGDHVQVLVGGYELTGDSNRLTIDDRRSVYDVTAFGDAAHKFITGARLMTLDHVGYLNAAAAASHPVLKSGEVQGSVSVFLGQNAAPVVGSVTYSLYAQQGKYSALPEVAKYVPFAALFANLNGLGGWGAALAVPVSFTNTTTGTVVNNGVATTKGGAAFLHILQAAASDTYTIILEGSATGAFGGEQTTLVTFGLNASALGSEYKALAGAVPQYVRFKATRTGSAGNSVRHVVVKLDDSGGTLRTFANGDISSVDIPLTYDQHDVTGFGDAAHKFINGQLQAPITLKGFLTTTALTGTHTVINGALVAGSQVTLRVAVGNNAAPQVSVDPEYSGEFIIESYKPTLETGKAVMFEATLKPAIGTAPAWGVMAA